MSAVAQNTVPRSFTTYLLKYAIHTWIGLFLSAWPIRKPTLSNFKIAYDCTAINILPWIIYLYSFPSLRCSSKRCGDCYGSWDLCKELGSSPARGNSGGNRTNSDVAQRQSSAVMAWLLKPLAVKQMSRVYSHVCSHGPCSMQLLLRFSNRSNNRSGTSKGGRLTGTVLRKYSRVWRLIRTKALHHKKLPESRDPQAPLHQSNVTSNTDNNMPYIEHGIMGKLGSNRGVQYPALSLRLDHENT